MSVDLKQSILLLLKLQEIDEVLFKLGEEEQRPSPDFLTAKTQVEEADRNLRAADKAFREIERERRAYELRMITLREDLSKAEAKRRETRNTKEEFSASKDLENFQKKISDYQTSLEEKTKVATERAALKSEKQAAVDTATTAYKAAQAEREVRIKTIHAERDRYVAQRQEYISQVDEMVFSMYERVQKIRKGNGIAVLKNLVCSACHVSIPAHMANILQEMTQIITCPSCSRILFPESLVAESQPTKEAV